VLLSRPDIRKRIEASDIYVSPSLEENQWGEASIDLRLGFDFTKILPAEGATFSVARGLSTISASNLWSTKRLREKDEHGEREHYILRPGDFVLALTHETIQIPPDLIGLVEGRSTYARMGLTMHQTAPWIQPGWRGQITLEIRNAGPLHISLTPLLDRPCQLSFFTLSSPLGEQEAYGSQDGGRFQNQTTVFGPEKGC
jgi:dCTP deaminase